MLTRRHLAVIQAALRYFREELGPHGAEAAGSYLDEPLEDELTSEKLDQLRQLLRRCELRYACCDRAVTALVCPELFPSIDEAKLAASAQGRGVRIAAVLIPTDTT